VGREKREKREREREGERERERVSEEREGERERGETDMSKVTTGWEVKSWLCVFDGDGDDSRGEEWRKHVSDE